jgi:hypothetical protein
MSAPNPFTLPRTWSTLTFFGKAGTVRLPGLVKEIDGHDATELWVVQKGQNFSWATTIWRGRLLREGIKIKVQIPDQATFDAYQIAAGRLQPKPPAAGGTFKQVSWYIVNGALNFAGITRVGIRSIGTPRIQANLGQIAVVDLIEFRPPVLSPVGPPDPPKQLTENDLKAQKVAELTKKIKTLQGQGL